MDDSEAVDPASGKTISSELSHQEAGSFVASWRSKLLAAECVTLPVIRLNILKCSRLKKSFVALIPRHTTTILVLLEKGR